MEFLTVSSGLHRVHHDILGSHERQLRQEMLLDHLRIDYQTVHHIQIQIQNAVHCQKSFRYAETLIGGIIQCPLKPLCRCHQHGIDHITHHIIGERGDPLAPHGVPLVCHGRGPDLALLKGFLHLLEMLQKADIIGELMGALGNACQDIDHPGIYLAGIRLSGYRITIRKTHLSGYHPIRQTAFLMISVKKLQKAGLGTGRPLGPKQLHRIQHMIQILQIQAQLLQPQGRPLAHGRRLGRLKMGEGQCRLILVGFGKSCQLGHDIDQLLSYQPQGLCHDNNIGIVSHITGGRAQMNDALCQGTLQAVGIHMGHYIMTHLALPLLRRLVIDVLGMAFHLVDLCDGQSQILLCLRQGNPQSPPGFKLFIRREDILHLLAGVAF